MELYQNHSGGGGGEMNFLYNSHPLEIEIRFKSYFLSTHQFLPLQTPHPTHTETHTLGIRIIKWSFSDKDRNMSHSSEA